MNALQIADNFDIYAIDHTPDGWPPVQQKQLTEAALMLRKQHEAIMKLRNALNIINRMSYARSAQEQVCMLALADTDGFVK